jgi:hypothetical protein
MSASGNNYSGVQFFAKMEGVTATNYLPRIQLILEYDIEFKQPAFQNRPSSFESSIIGSTLSTIPDGSTPETTRTYHCVSFTLNGDGDDYRFERVDGQAGSLNFDAEEMFNVYYTRTSMQYFDGRAADYYGPQPRKPLTWSPPS